MQAVTEYFARRAVQAGRAWLLALAIATSVVSPALAQTEGRISAGVSLTASVTTHSDVGSAISVGPLVRLNPKRGWGLAGALNWLSAGLEHPSGDPADFVRLNARPLMGGVSYTVGSDRVLIGVSLVAGPSFNKVKFDDDYTAVGVESIDADVSVAVRPGVGVTWTLAPRVAIVGFGGYLFNSPDITYRTPAGLEIRDRWNANAVVFSVGAVYSLF